MRRRRKRKKGEGGLMKEYFVYYYEEKKKWIGIKSKTCGKRVVKRIRVSERDINILIYS